MARSVLSGDRGLVGAAVARYVLSGDRGLVRVKGSRPGEEDYGTAILSSAGIGVSSG